MQYEVVIEIPHSVHHKKLHFDRNTAEQARNAGARKGRVVSVRKVDWTCKFETPYRLRNGVLP